MMTPLQETSQLFLKVNKQHNELIRLRLHARGTPVENDVIDAIAAMALAKHKLSVTIDQLTAIEKEKDYKL
mgnify:CR=1 FL=1